MDLEATLTDLAPRLLRYCVGRTADRDLGEEIAQEALAALVGCWRRSGSPRSVEAFVFTIARRRASRALLRRRLLEPLDAVAGWLTGGPDPEQRALDRRELDAVLERLAGLSAKERDALLLIAGGGLDTASAAEVLGISPSALKMRVHRARLHLRPPGETP